MNKICENTTSPNFVSTTEIRRCAKKSQKERKNV